MARNRTQLDKAAISKGRKLFANPLADRNTLAISIHSVTDNNSAIAISVIGIVEVTAMMIWPDTQAVWTDTEFDGVRSSGTRG
jgi:hypothetical protein